MTILFNKFHAYVNIDKFIGTFKKYYIKKPSLVSKQIHSKNKKNNNINENRRLKIISNLFYSPISQS